MISRVTAIFIIWPLLYKVAFDVEDLRWIMFGLSLRKLILTDPLSVISFAISDFYFIVI